MDLLDVYAKYNKLDLVPNRPQMASPDPDESWGETIALLAQAARDLGPDADADLARAFDWLRK